MWWSGWSGSRAFVAQPAPQVLRADGQHGGHRVEGRQRGRQRPHQHPSHLGAGGVRVLRPHQDRAGQGAQVRDLLLERDLAAIATILPAVFGRTPPARFHTRLSPNGAGRLTDLLGVEVNGTRDGNQVVFDNAFLAAPLPQSDKATRLLCERECARLLRIRRTQPTIAARVRARLFERPDEMPSLAEVAHDLRLNERTLRRRLTAEGTSYRRLRDEVRQSLAVNLLQTPGHSVTEIAARLGYSDPTSFTHAFTRWEGVAPSKFPEA